MTSTNGSRVSLTFALEFNDDWPPVAAECLQFERVGKALRLLVTPLFVGNLSVGDVIECTVDAVSQQVFDWRHVSKSDHTTFWLLGESHHAVLLDGLARLRLLGCSTVTAKQVCMHSVDVPGSVPIESVDAILDELDRGGIEVACPSFRHPE